MVNVTMDMYTLNWLKNTVDFYASCICTYITVFPFDDNKNFLAFVKFKRSLTHFESAAQETGNKPQYFL